jgi:preprotein translocase subunit SecG
MMNMLIFFAQIEDPYRGLKSAIFGGAMLVTAIFLIMLVLVQRGRGGGLAGAFGGAGGQSAFGAKAGDTFTKITIYTSTFWILLCMAALLVLNPPPKTTAAPPPGINDPTRTAPVEEVTPDNGAAEADGAGGVAEADGAGGVAEADGTAAADGATSDGTTSSDGAADGNDQ